MKLATRRFYVLWLTHCAGVLATALMTASPLARAADDSVVLNASHFTFSTQNSTPWKELLLSDSDGAARIRLQGLERGSFTQSFDSWTTTTSYLGDYQISVDSGYRVTGYRLEAMYDGDLIPAEPPAGWNGTNGTADNHALLQLGTGMPSDHMLYSGNLFTQPALNGSNTFTLETRGLSLSGDFHFYAEHSGAVTLTPAIWSHPDAGVYWTANSFARIELYRPILTVFTQAVPEPASYAMLLAGLLAMGYTRLPRHQHRIERQRS